MSHFGLVNYFWSTKNEIVIQGNRLILTIITIAEEPPSTPGSCDFEKGHGLCGYQRVSGVDQFNWTFGSRHFYSFPKTDHTTFDTDGEGMVQCLLFASYIEPRYYYNRIII